MKKTLLCSMLALPMMLCAQKQASVRLHPDLASDKISKHIYGQFTEHLGSCIYGGIWVGEDSSIPNTNGYRNDVLNALKELKVPNMRWPGGCFADEYHWRDGIGPKSQRPKMVNNNWGGTIEDNSFGTHEFLNLCELVGCEPYVSVNVGSGTVEEMAKWVEYMTSQGDSPMANLRRKNGRDKAWNVKFLGIGNESWGCGGSMRPEYYSDVYRRYTTYCRNYDDNKLFKVACGASDYDYNWTDVMMKTAGRNMDGISLHYYCVEEWGHKGSATDFTSENFYSTIAKARDIDNVLKRHIDVMDKYDPKKRVALMLDEWGTWWDVAPGTNPGHLFQQNTMRDAFVAAVSLNIFHQHADRLRMTNIAQMVNVLQAMILTKEDKMLLTPTYHVFEMYKVHQEATNIPLEICSEQTKASKDRVVPLLSASASRNDEGVIHISLANLDLEQSQTVTISLGGVKVKDVKGRILTSAKITDCNTFENKDVIKPETFKKAKMEKDNLVVEMPARAIVVLEVQAK